MTDIITTAERALIDQHIEKQGVTKCANGATWHPGYEWDGKHLVSKDVEKTRWAGSAASKGRSERVQKRRAAVAKHYNAGMTAEEISSLLNVKIHQVYADASSQGLHFSRSETHMKNGGADELARVKAAFTNDISGAELARRLGISERSVVRHLKALGLQTKAMKRANG
ncbi:hypothetical protein A8B82_15135 [Sulfitobacter sp. EhC04]|uniref:helix-turn-helix domain-containing protein n=1 Tax=Sulfitobacter sp. EhC04 TaxID=1849168 RepID=UPI0007F375FF|nr:helix-turn-helix domain-containing protein [Sulfitobacter sp. EhC04]OAN76726.1 hypothetical protein A8B82_15135 [Sulfitobacter sp. EhC04]